MSQGFTTGRVLSSPVREKLFAARTYYVRTDGSDSNTGLSDSAVGAFLTIQKAVDTVAGLDLVTFNVTIQVGDGTYTAGAAVTGPWLGSGTVTLLGNTTTPASCIVSVTGGHCVTANFGARLTVSGFEFRTTTSGIALLAQGNSYLTLGTAVRFGACANYHMFANTQATILCQVAYSIVGAAQIHWITDSGGCILSGGNTVTVTGTPAFSVAFAYAIITGTILAAGITFSGAATGTRYTVASNAVINTNGGGATYLPGNVVGSAVTGGQYV